MCVCICVCVSFYFNYNKIKGTLLNLSEEYDNGESCGSVSRKPAKSNPE